MCDVGQAGIMCRGLRVENVSKREEMMVVRKT